MIGKDGLRRKWPRLYDELEACGLPWTVEPGGRHYHIRLAGRLVQTLPLSFSTGAGSAGNNMLSNVRRQIRALLSERVGVQSSLPPGTTGDRHDRQHRTDPRAHPQTPSQGD